ncbi:hypothetical protein ACJIZ3_008834 [Penstemon smallii]|uniref:Transmembrane protein n=1 Tax=Penstemon smallii TaxID=265156 RepID=A0ABD3TC05_9LAMI
MRTNLAIGPFLLFGNSLHLLVAVVLFVGRIKVLEVLLIPTFRSLIKTKQVIDIRDEFMHLRLK